MDNKRIILHIDMDAFFASIEQRDNPNLKGKPVIIAGDPNKRSVVSTCSYEARKYGIYSSMPSKTAYRLCPFGTFIKLRINYYKEVSEQIFNIYHEYTDLVEPLSLDEAFLDVTKNKFGMKSGVEIALDIKEKIKKKVNLTASAGVSYNKFFAKIASDYNKPDGLTEITEENYERILDDLDIRKFFGIGKVSANSLNRIGIYTGKDLRQLSEEQLTDIMHSRGSVIYKYIRGLDDRPVDENKKRKSIGKEKTLVNDIHKDSVLEYLKDEAKLLAESLSNKNIKGKTITIKIKYNDFSEFTRRATSKDEIQSEEEIMNMVKSILDKNPLNDKLIRLVGIYISNLTNEEKKFEQISLLDSI